MTLATPAIEPTPALRTDAAWLDAHWMPYTGNRNFKADPRMIVEARVPTSPMATAARSSTASRACGARASATAALKSPKR